jgi:hypothetical protein
MRLSALTDSGESLSRQEHDSITEIKLVRRRTLAAQRSENQPQSPPWDGTSFPSMKEAQSAAPNRDMVLDAIKKNSLAPQMYDPPQSPPPSAGIPQLPQIKRYTLSDSPPTGPVRASSPIRKLRKNHEHNSSTASLPNNASSARYVSGDGRTPSPGRTNRRKSTADDIPTPPVLEVPNVPQSAVGDGANTPTGQSKRPTTFAEMGFPGVKAQEKECIIM